MKITPGYLEQNRLLHAPGSYGFGGKRWAQVVRGRNAHLSQEGVDWWLGELRGRFEIAYTKESQGELIVVVEPQKP